MDDFDPLADVFGDDFDPTAGLLDDVDVDAAENVTKVVEEEKKEEEEVSSSTDFSSSQEGDDSKVPEVVLRTVLCKVLEDESLDYAISAANDLLASTKKKPRPDRVKLLLNLLLPLVERSTPKQTKRMCKRIVRRVAGKKRRSERRGSFEVLSLETLLPKLNKPVILSSLDIFKEDKAEMEKLWGIDESRKRYNDDLYKLISKIAPVSEKKLERRRMQMNAILSRVKKAAKARKTESSKDASTEIIGENSSESQVSVLDMLLGNSGSAQKDIIVPRFTMNFAGKDLLLDAGLKLAYGRRYGLVGQNGIGKTTLLRFIAAKAIKGIPKDLKICHVAQEAVADERTCIQAVLDADLERAALLERVKELEAMDEGDEDAAQELGVVYQALAEMGSSDAEARAGKILSGLQFSKEMQNAPTSSLSGGWRMRVSLAAALFVEPELLLLDEPTNHLDLQAVLWLENYCRIEFDATLIVVSHDREFLNDVTTDIIHVANQTLEYYKGNFDGFEETRAERVRQNRKKYEANAKKRAHMQKFIDKFRCSAARASLVQSRIKALKRLETVEMIEGGGATLQLSFPDPEKLDPPILQLQDVGFTYQEKDEKDPTKYLLRAMNLNIDQKTRIAIVGVNGAGKSTLLNLLVGKLRASRGKVFSHGRLRVGHFTQHHVELLSIGSSSLNVMRELFPGENDQVYRNHLGRFGVSGNMALQNTSTLSGGQKSRVALAIMSYRKPHILILDEPTNHLDMETSESLMLALTQYKGGVVCVSHDQHFITGVLGSNSHDDIGGELWVVGDGTLRRFDGDFKTYKKREMKKMMSERVGKRRRR